MISRKWLLPTIAVLLGMGFLARLGIWQLDRLEQRQARNAELQLVLNSKPLDLGNLGLPDDLQSLRDRTVFVLGEFDFSELVLLKLQNWAGRPGVHLIVPLVLNDDDRAVLVDRGWIPESDVAEENWFEEPGPIRVEGYIALSQTLDRPEVDSDLSDGPQREWYRIDIKAIQSQIPYPLLPFYVSQAPAPNGNSELPYRSEREVDLSEGPHLGYAIQWFIFSMMLGGAYLIYVNKNLVAERTAVP
jgi:surfeit locus 1 family protein